MGQLQAGQLRERPRQWLVTALRVSLPRPARVYQFVLRLPALNRVVLTDDATQEIVEPVSGAAVPRCGID